MAKHRAGDRRIISISIPEELARKLDRRVGKGRNDGSSATITKMIQNGLETEQIVAIQTPVSEQRSASGVPGEIRIEKDTMGELEKAYAIASAVFVGGSLVPHGGHNILEPGRFGVPV